MNDRGTILKILLQKPGELGIYNLEATEVRIAEFGARFGLNLKGLPATYGTSKFRLITWQSWVDEVINPEKIWGIWAPSDASLALVNRDLEAQFGRTIIYALGLREMRPPEAAYQGLVFKKTDEPEGPTFRLSLQAASLHGYMLFTREHGLRLEGPPVLNEPTMILDGRRADEPPDKWTWGVFVLGGSHDWDKIQEQLVGRFGEGARLAT